MAEYRRIAPDLSPQPILVIETGRKIQCPSYGLDHAFCVSLNEVRLGEKHRGQRFVVVVIVAVEVIEQFTEVHIEALRSEEHTSELQSLAYLVCRLLLEK